MRILAVDDDRAILELLREALEVSGYDDVTTASSGEAAVDVIANTESPFDCFLVDIQMPGMDGVELCSHIRTLPEYHRKPIVMVTAMSQKTYIDRAFSAGATDYITKPFDFLEVGTRLSLAQSQMSTQAQHSEEPAFTQHKAPHVFNVEQSLCEPVELLGIDQVVGFVAFDNYLLQLTRSHLFLSSVFAVKIFGIEDIFTRVSTEEFRSLLKDVAKSITECTDPTGSLTSYRGNGVFLCMNPRGNKTSHSELEANLHQKAGNLKLSMVTTAIDDVQLIVGEQISLGLLSRSGSLTHLRRAIEKVETKSLFLQKMQMSYDSGQLNEKRDEEKQAQKKVGYEALLRESLAEGIGIQDLRQA